MLTIFSFSFFCMCICRSNDNDEMTKKKVNLVFEKIQTLKSRATASSQGDSNVRLCFFISTFAKVKDP